MNCIKYFKSFNHLGIIRREMPSFKLSLWDSSVFINNVIPPGETESKILVAMLFPTNNKPKKINMCRNSDDTIESFLQRFRLKIEQLNKKLKKPCDDILSIEIDGITVSLNSKCSEVFEAKNSNINLHINEKKFKIIVDAPIINDLLLNKPPYQGLLLYPYAFDKGYNVSIANSNYLWYRVESKNEVQVGINMTYIPTADDIDCCLKLVCNPRNEEGRFGPQVEVLSTIVVKNTIQVYPFEKRLVKKPDNSIRIMSYNILAGDYTKTKEAKNDMYPYCAAHIIDSSYRNPLLLRELMAYDADIICMQEVEQKFFNRELVPLLKKLMDMDGKYLKKDGNRNEGLSCFYSSKKFAILEQFDIKLKNVDNLEVYCGSVLENILSDELWKQGLEKKTVFQAILFEMISDKKQLLLVCNTHLISDPEGDLIRLLQALVEITIINKIKKNINDLYPDHNLSIIFCGDFNSTPESGVFDLVTKLLLPEELNQVTILNDLKNGLDFKMHSAYDANVQYSNYTNTFSGLLDYIYFTNQHLDLIQVLPMPSHSDVTQHGGLPSIHFPSDHLALVADFKIKCEN